MYINLVTAVASAYASVLMLILECIMYSQLINYFILNNLVFKQGTTLVMLLSKIDQIYEGFEENKYKLGVFIDLSKLLIQLTKNIIKKNENIWYK